MIRSIWSKLVFWGFNYEDEPKAVRNLIRAGKRRDELIATDSDGGLDLPDPINFRVQSVQGGTLVESRWYNAKTDNHERRLQIVTPDENLSEAIGKIVTMEMLKR